MQFEYSNSEKLFRRASIMSDVYKTAMTPMSAAAATPPAATFLTPALPVALDFTVVVAEPEPEPELVASLTLMPKLVEVSATPLTVVVQTLVAVVVAVQAVQLVHAALELQLPDVQPAQSDDGQPLPPHQAVQASVVQEPADPHGPQPPLPNGEPSLGVQPPKPPKPPVGVAPAQGACEGVSYCRESRGRRETYAGDGVGRSEGSPVAARRAVGMSRRIRREGARHGRGP